MCCNIEAYSRRERRVFSAPPSDANIYLSKAPKDIMTVGPILWAQPALHVVCMVRDPRDVITSMHGKDPDRYWTGLKFWNAYLPYWRKIRDPPIHHDQVRRLRPRPRRDATSPIDEDAVSRTERPVQQIPRGCQTVTVLQSHLAVSLRFGLRAWGAGETTDLALRNNLICMARSRRISWRSGTKTTAPGDKSSKVFSPTGAGVITQSISVGRISGFDARWGTSGRSSCWSAEWA